MAQSIIQTVRLKKQQGERMVVISLYDAPSATLSCESGVDLLLVGDSLGNVILGYDHTLPVTIEVMEHHTGAVVRGVKSSSRPDVPVIADMPFGSYHSGPEVTVANASRLMRAGAGAVKVEGASETVQAAVRLLTDMGVPVIGHIGYTPQMALTMERVVHDKTDAAIQKLIDDALAMERAGCFGVVLEVVRIEVAAEITRQLSIPTIGIGSGPHCDGQVLIFHELTGLTANSPYRFVKRFAEAHAELEKGTRAYIEEVRAGSFPGETHGWKVSPNQ